MVTRFPRRTSVLHRLISILSTCVCIGFIAARVDSAEVRVWTDSTGKQSTEAEFVSFKNGKVTLRKPGTTKTVTLPFDRLSDEDQVYVEDLVEAMEADQEEQERTNRRAAANDEAETEEETEAVTNRARSKPSNITNSVRGAAYRQETTNRLRNLSLAMFNYESAKRRYPTSGTQVKGKPGLSWRVALLPYLEQNALYRQFKLNEPWDSEHNLKLVEKMPKVFLSAGSNAPKGYTNFQAVVSDEAIIMPVGLRGTRIRDVRDGTSRTLLLVEVDDTEATIWTKPDDYEWDKQNPTAGLGHIWPGYFMATLADGSVRRVPISIGNDSLNALMTRAGGENYRLE